MTDELLVEEKVVGFYAMDRCNGESIFNAVKDGLIRLLIDITRCRSMTFDGAASFSTHRVGVDARIKQVSPTSLHTDCHMYCVHPTVQDNTKNVPIMRDFIQLVNNLIAFLQYSPMRCAIV